MTRYRLHVRDGGDKKLPQRHGQIGQRQTDARTGNDIRESDWAFFHQCYAHTYRAHLSTPYLNLDFFLRLGESLPAHTMMVLGDRQGTPLCAALNRSCASLSWSAICAAAALKCLSAAC